jgi:hypothetical protein
MKLIFASLLCVSAYASALYFKGTKPVIEQRIVHVIEIGPGHPPKAYDLVEDVK